MRIAIIHAGGVEYLAGSPDASLRGFPEAAGWVVEGTAVNQVEAKIRAPGVRWIDRGKLRNSVRFSTTRTFATEAAAEAFSAGYDATPPPVPGLLVFQTTGPELGEEYLYLPEAVLQPPQRAVRGCSVTLHYEARGGAMRRWVPSVDLPALQYRVVEADGADGWEKWWEVGFFSAAVLSGSAAAGWTGEGLVYRLEHSEDLATWAVAKYTDCAGSPVAVDGGWEYWSRAIFPVDSVEKSGMLSLVSTALTGNTQNNPFTALTIAGAIQSLANFPYTMPTDAAQLQTDLRALGWAGATVAASTDVDWEIVIPNVDFSGYGNSSRLSWPAWYSVGPLGDLITVDGTALAGAFTNGAGVRTNLANQFSRLRITTN